MNRYTPTTQHTQTQTQDKYVSVLTGVLLYSTHIQLFSQNQSLLSPISDQIFIKKSVRRIRRRKTKTTTTTGGTTLEATIIIEE